MRRISPYWLSSPTGYADPLDKIGIIPGAEVWETASRRRVGVSLETVMASKDKGGKAPKKAAAKDLKQKRLDKKNKQAVKGGGSPKAT